MPGIEDSRFQTALILILEHDTNGAMGLVVNKPFLSMAFKDLVTQMNVVDVEQIVPFKLHFGGPVESGRGFILHTPDKRADSTKEICPGLCLTSTEDLLKDMMIGKGPRQSLFMLGYAGWEAGQLEDELKGNTWVTMPADPRILFQTDIDMRWQASLLQSGIDPARLTLFAGQA